MSHLNDPVSANSAPNHMGLFGASLIIMMNFMILWKQLTEGKSSWFYVNSWLKGKVWGKIQYRTIWKFNNKLSWLFSNFMRLKILFFDPENTVCLQDIVSVCNLFRCLKSISIHWTIPQNRIFSLSWEFKWESTSERQLSLSTSLSTTNFIKQVA